MAIALGMVMAGSGNLECLRLFRVLRRRVDSEASPGFHPHPNPNPNPRTPALTLDPDPDPEHRPLTTEH